MKLFLDFKEVGSYASKFDLQPVLYSHICCQCRMECGITEISNIQDMMETACGIEHLVIKE